MFTVSDRVVVTEPETVKSPETTALPETFNEARVVAPASRVFVPASYYKYHHRYRHQIVGR